MSVISEGTAQHFTWGDNCDGWHLVESDKLSVIKEKVPSGASETRHLHNNAEQFFYILSGVATIELDDQLLQLKANQGLHIPAGSKHQVCNQHTCDLEFIVTSTPASHGDRVELPADA